MNKDGNAEAKWNFRIRGRHEGRMLCRRWNYMVKTRLKLGDFMLEMTTNEKTLIKLRYLR